MSKNYRNYIGNIEHNDRKGKGIFNLFNLIMDTRISIQATGGTENIYNEGFVTYKSHTFTSPGNFTVNVLGTGPFGTTVEYLVVAGGGSGGTTNACGGGGGAGGFRTGVGFPVGAGTTYSITVGAGGASVPAPTPSSVQGNNGNPSTFSTITSSGGGGGGGRTGGSGGGGNSGGYSPSTNEYRGTGNNPPQSPAQGYPGGSRDRVYIPPAELVNNPCGGGGGAGNVGFDGNQTPLLGGNGGSGVISTFRTGIGVTYAGGGGGGSYPGPTGGTGGSGGGGNGGGSSVGATNGGTNTGGGGGGGYGTNPAPGAGGSGIVIIRYRIE